MSVDKSGANRQHAYILYEGVYVGLYEVVHNNSEMTKEGGLNKLRMRIAYTGKDKNDFCRLFPKTKDRDKVLFFFLRSTKPLS